MVGGLCARVALRAPDLPPSMTPQHLRNAKLRVVTKPDF